MKLKDRLVLRQVAAEWIVIPMSTSTLNLNGVLNLNESGAFLWRKLKEGSDRDGLVNALTQEYDVTYAEAADDVDVFLQKLDEAGCFE